MPSSSKKQHNFMAAIAHSPSFAKKAGVPQSVGKDFTQADKGKKFMNPTARKKGDNVNPSANETQLPDDIAAEATRMKKDGAQARSMGRKAFNTQLKSANSKFVPSMPRKIKAKFAEGGEVSDEDTMSESAKKNIADTDVAKSKAEDAKGKLNPSKKRGFFGSLFTGHLKDYNAQEKRKRDLSKTFGGMKSAATMDAEKKRADLDNKDKVDLSEGLQTKTESAPAQKKQSFGEAFKAAKGKNFTWNGKKYSGAMKSSAPKKKTASNGTDSKQRFVDNMATNLAKKKSGWQPFSGQTDSNQAKLNAEAKARAAARQKAKDDAKAAGKKKKDAEKANFKPSANKAFNYAKGGLVSSRADGIASRGRTKCKIR